MLLFYEQFNTQDYFLTEFISDFLKSPLVVRKSQLLRAKLTNCCHRSSHLTLCKKANNLFSKNVELFLYAYFSVTELTTYCL